MMLLEAGLAEDHLSKQKAKKCLNKISFASKKHAGVAISPSIISDGSWK